MVYLNRWKRTLTWPLARGMRAVVVASRRLLTGPVAALGPVLVVVEGRNDIHFLRRIAAILHADNPSLPDLIEAERRLDLLFVRSGGGDSSWTFQLAGLKLPEFHLLDRETPPVTQSRQQLAAMLNSRPQCRAAVTSKRSLENYLHSSAVFEASGIAVEVSDEEDVPELVARSAHQSQHVGTPWEQLTTRCRRRLRYQAKRWLNTRAVERMTPERLVERDPNGEVRSWLETIGMLIGFRSAGNAGG